MNDKKYIQYTNSVYSIKTVNQYYKNYIKYIYIYI